MSAPKPTLPTTVAELACKAEACRRVWNDIPTSGLRDHIARDNFIEASFKLIEACLAAQPQPTTAAPATNGREGDDVLREFLEYSKDFSRDEKLDSGLCALVVLVRRALDAR